MKYYMAFHEGQLIRESDTYVPSKGLPEGSYIRSNNCWYVLLRGQLTSINLCDVPKTLRTFLLLLS